MKTRLMLLIGGIFCIVGGCKNIFIKSVPFGGTVRSVEQGTVSEYDYFRLSHACIIPYAYYSQNTVTNLISSIVVPVTSAEYRDSLYAAFFKKYPADSFNDYFSGWFDTIKNKPSVFVLLKQTDLTRADLKKLLIGADTLERNISGTRITSLSDLDEKVKGALESASISTDNSVFIEEGGTPGNDHGFGWFLMICGVLLTGGTIISFLNKMAG